MIRNLAPVLLLALFTTLPGCSGGPEGEALPLHKVTGTVQFDGKPLAQGVLVADPADDRGTPVQASITDGKFELQAPEGAKKIRITSNSTTGEKDEYGEPIDNQLIPGKYNADTTLEKTVEANDTNKWEFALDK